jgi:hypothetical protein
VENIPQVGAIGITRLWLKAKIVDENGRRVPKGACPWASMRSAVAGVMTCYYKDEAASSERAPPRGLALDRDMARQR